MADRLFPPDPPDDHLPVPYDAWECPSCATVNAAEEAWCVHCGLSRPGGDEAG